MDQHVGTSRNDRAKAPDIGAPSALLLGWCGLIAIAGSLAIVAANAVGSVLVPDYNWISDTISDLAAGRYENIQDIGFYAFSGALLACAIGASNVHAGTGRWTAGILGLAVMAALVVVIGARNEYGDSDSKSTWDVHLGLVYALMLMFLVVTLSMRDGMRQVRSIYSPITLACIGLFVVTGSAYFAAPTGYDGLIERAVGLVAIAWVIVFSRMLLDLRREIAA